MSNAYKYICLLLVMQWLSGYSALAQVPDESEFVLYRTWDGLSGNNITGLVQDEKGYVWIGTTNGLNRFDGTSFKTYYKSSPDISLPHSFIHRLRIHNGNELVISTQGGAMALNTNTLRSTSFVIPSDKQHFYYYNSGRDALKDAAGNYVVSTVSGFFVFDTTGKLLVKHIPVKNPEVDRMPPTYGEDLYRLKSGMVMQNNSDIYSSYNPFTRKLHIPDAGEKDSLEKIVKGAASKHWMKRFVWGRQDEFIVFDDDKPAIIISADGSGKIVENPTPQEVCHEIQWKSNCWYLDDNLIAVNAMHTGFFLFKYDPVTHIMQTDGKKYFPNKFVSVIMQDKDGCLWIGTDDGLYKHKMNKNVFITRNLEEGPAGIKDIWVEGIVTDSTKIYAGSIRYSGILILDKQTMVVEKQLPFNKNDNGASNTNSLIRLDNDTLLAGTSRGLAWINVRNNTTGKLKLPTELEDYEIAEISYLFKDSQGYVWILYFADHCVVRYNPRNRSFYRIPVEGNPYYKLLKYAETIAEDHDGNVWLGGSMGICRWSPGKQKVDTAIIFPDVSASGYARLNIIGLDAEDCLWLTNPDGEIIQFDLRTNKLALRLPQTKANFMVHAYTLVPGEGIWLATDMGFVRFDIHDYSLHKFSIFDGMPPNRVSTFRQNLFYDRVTGNIYFGAKQYVAHFPASSNKRLVVRPRLVIEKVITRDSSYLDASRSLNIPYTQKDIQVYFTGINFADPENTVFYYRFLYGEDTAWTYLGHQPTINLHNLSAGQYALNIKMASLANSWPDQLKQVNFVINPPFWKESWFSLLLVLIVGILVYAIYKWRLQQLQHKVSIDRQLGEYEIKALHAQMNPHFIFNSLASIKQMIMDNEQENASRYMNKFARLIRLTLEQSKESFITLRENNQYLVSYLEMEQLRFSHSFEYEFILAEDIEDDIVKVPPLMMQPLVENSIWHGLLNKPGAKKVRIKYYAEGESLVCEVEDNGVGFIKTNPAKKEHKSIGIQNLYKRLMLLNSKYGYHCRLQIEDKLTLGLPESGARVVLTLPLLKDV
jgi:ligand-binding sensor domain-containing protein